MLSVIGAGLIICGTAAGTYGGSQTRQPGENTVGIYRLFGADGVGAFLQADGAAELVGALAEKSRPPVCGFYRRCLEEMPSLGQRSFRKIWCDSLGSCRELLLREDEQDALEELGAVLGRFDLKQQQRAIHYCKQG